MENMEYFCVSHNYTQKRPRRRRRRRLHRRPPSLYMYIHCFFRIEKNHPEIVCFARDYASRDQIYHLTLRDTTVRTQTPLEYYTTYTIDTI